VPFTKYFNGRLRLKIKFDKYPDYVVETEKEVYIEHDSLITFVETDKPVYKPGQDVNIRILMLKHDLKPWKKTVCHSLSVNKIIVNTIVIVLIKQQYIFKKRESLFIKSFNNRIKRREELSHLIISSLPLFLDTKSMDRESIRSAGGAMGQRQHRKWNGAIKIRTIS